jgi:4-carboxymuconolactone decarboxylase
MAVSDTARKNHDQLLPGHVSTFKVTDPELIEVFDNFAFDEVLRHSRLDLRTRLMAQLAALIGCQALSEYRVMLGAALANGVTPSEVKEIVYQDLLGVLTVLVPFIGYPRTLNALAAVNEIAPASTEGQ